MTESTELAGIELRPIATTLDALREDVVLAGIIDVATDRRRALKRYLLAELHRPGTKLEDELGYALVTDPKPRPTVVDEPAFQAWWLENRDDGRIVETIDVEALEECLDGKYDGLAEEPPLSERLASLLDEIPGAIRREVVLPKNAAKDAAKPANARELEDGRLVDKNTGQVIPGLEILPPGTPDVRTYPDTDALGAIIEQVRDRLSPIPGDDEA